MRSPSAAQDGSGEGDIDLTPMLDVVFIMLIFFIVTSTFVKEPGAEISRVEARAVRRGREMGMSKMSSRGGQTSGQVYRIGRRALRWCIMPTRL